MISNGTKVYYKMPRCQCVGGGWTESYGIVIGSIESPNGTFYKVSTDYQGTFVVPQSNIIREVI